MNPLVLVVDDSLHVRQEVAALLAREFPGYRTRAVGSGEESIEVTQAEEVAAVIMDIGLPGMSGIEATRQILALNPRTPVVMLSIHEGEPYVSEAQAAGASGYVAKRKMGRELLPALKAVLTESFQHPGTPEGSSGQGGLE